MIQLKKLKKINSFTWQYKKLLTQKSNELLMSLYAGIHMNDGSIQHKDIILIHKSASVSA